MEKRVEQLWFDGKDGDPVCAEVALYENAAVASVEQGKATRGQFVAALAKAIPGYRWRVESCGPNGCGYLITSAEAMNGRIAVNVCDLDALTPRDGSFNPVALLMSDFCSVHSPRIEPTNQWDSSAVVLDGPAAADVLRVEALVELLQTSIGPRKLGRRVRCYREGPRGGWSEIRMGRKVAR